MQKHHLTYSYLPFGLPVVYTEESGSIFQTEGLSLISNYFCIQDLSLLSMFLNLALRRAVSCILRNNVVLVVFQLCLTVRMNMVLSHN